MKPEEQRVLDAVRKIDLRLIARYDVRTPAAQELLDAQHALLASELPPDALEQAKRLTLESWKADHLRGELVRRLPQPIQARLEGRGDLFEAWWAEYEQWRKEREGT